MSNELEQPAWEWLKQFGFQADSAVMSDIQPGLSYQFSGLKLEATATGNRYFIPVVLFTGILRTNRSQSLISFEIPQEAISKAHCAAYLCYFLKENTDKHFEHLLQQEDWLRFGNEHQHLLPWVAELIQSELEGERFRQRPKCTVDREWLKLALKDLERQLIDSADSSTVILEFNGRTLSIWHENQPIIVTATGDVWPYRYEIAAKHLRQRPKRLISDQVDVSIWEDTLIIDRYHFKGVTELLELSRNSHESD